jgi:hypothetical protein
MNGDDLFLLRDFRKNNKDDYMMKNQEEMMNIKNIK